MGIIDLQGDIDGRAQNRLPPPSGAAENDEHIDVAVGSFLAAGHAPEQADADAREAGPDPAPVEAIGEQVRPGKLEARQSVGRRRLGIQLDASLSDNGDAQRLEVADRPPRGRRRQPALARKLVRCEPVGWVTEKVSQYSGTTGAAEDFQERTHFNFEMSSFPNNPSWSPLLAPAR